MVFAQEFMPTYSFYLRLRSIINVGATARDAHHVECDNCRVLVGLCYRLRCQAPGCNGGVVLQTAWSKVTRKLRDMPQTDRPGTFLPKTCPTSMKPTSRGTPVATGRAPPARLPNCNTALDFDRWTTLNAIHDELPLEPEANSHNTTKRCPMQV